MSYDNDDNNVYNVDLQQADNLLPQNQLLMPKIMRYAVIIKKY